MELWQTGLRMNKICPPGSNVDSNHLSIPYMKHENSTKIFAMNASTLGKLMNWWFGCWMEFPVDQTAMRNSDLLDEINNLRKETRIGRKVHSIKMPVQKPKVLYTTKTGEKFRKIHPLLSQLFQVWMIHIPHDTQHLKDEQLDCNSRSSHNTFGIPIFHKQKGFC